MRSLFKLRKTSCFLNDLKLAIYSGNNRAYSTASAFLCWKFLMEASIGKGAPSSTRAGI